MRRSQSRDLKSLFGTLVAHGNPRARTGLGTWQSTSKLDTSLSAAVTTLQLAKDAGDAASHVPYVKAVAGVLSQIIRIRDEIRANNERCEEIINLVQLKSTTILQSLDKIYETKGAEGFEDLKSDLEAYADFLQAVLQKELEPFKTQPRWTSYINRSKNAGDLQRLERELNEFKDRFSFKRLVEISTVLLSNPAPQVEAIPQALPPSPKLVIGRDSVVESVVQVTLSPSGPRVVILGQGGIGKTTIATIVLHDSRITSAYPTIYFVSSELAPTAELLENRVADALFIPQNERGTGLVSRIVDRLRKNAHPILLYIDNLETVWEVESEQHKVDHFLEVLSGASSKLALLVTMRGTQEPKTSFPWDSTILTGLDIDVSVVMYEKLSGKSTDTSARELLLKFGGSPLAIKLFSSMVKEGDKPSQLLSSWNKNGVKTFEIGGKHRLSSLEQSIRLSVFSPRIDDTARLVLGLIALMPDGLSTSSPWFEGFESILPDKTILQPILRALRRTALLDELGEPSRWQMLPPIRQFCLQLIESTAPSVVSLVDLYIETIAKHRNYSSSASQVIIIPEMANIRGLLLHGINLRPLPDLIGAASADYANWTYWQNIDDSTFLSRFICSSVPKGQQAYIYLTQGKLHHRWSRQDAAEASFSRALVFYGEVQNQMGEANAHKFMGDLQIYRDQLDGAEASFTRALELYSGVQFPLGEAITHESIGDLHMRRDQLDAAEASFTRALEFYGDIRDRLGEANIYQSIGNLQMRRDRLDAAEVSFNRALKLYIEVQSGLGRANTHTFIGDLLLRQNRLDAAEVSLTQALEHYGKMHDRLGEANIYNTLGNIHMHREQPDAAEASYNRAMELYHDVGEHRGEANAHNIIAVLHMAQGRLDAAEASFTRAVELYGVVLNPLGEANAHVFIASLHRHRKQLKSTEVSLTRALELYRKIQDEWGIATCTSLLEEIHDSIQELGAVDSSFS
ncbi:hypothetical protein DL96DRAFT_1819179 [Flagelloscypha sp. PMI_526]|nr:hypothetical protein DL96DRAFT_1819179 [Flagelloscypha sp. PMI_526]